MAVVLSSPHRQFYVYGAIICKTMEEAFAIQEGQILDIEKIKFSRRINNICK